MSKKGEEKTPTVSSSEEEVSSSEEEDEVCSKAPSAAVMKPALAVAAATEKDSETDSDSEPEKVVTLAAATTEKDSKSGSQSGSEEGESEEGESESEAMEVVTTKRPVNESKDKVESSVRKRSRELESDEGSKDKVESSVRKLSRELEESDEGVKRIKKERKPYFQRLWTEDDEIALLQGMVDLKNDTDKVYPLLKEKISFECTRVQFMEKIRHLKRKYENNVAKFKNVDDPTFFKALDQKAFDLSKLVWGAARESAVVKSSGKKSKNVESSSLVGALVGFGMDELGAEKGVCRLSSEDKKIFEEQLTALQSRELNFHLKKAKFLHHLLRKMDEASR